MSTKVFCLFFCCCWSEEALFRAGFADFVGITGLGMPLLDISSAFGSTTRSGMFKRGIVGSNTSSDPSGVSHSLAVQLNFRSLTPGCLFFLAPSTFEAALFFFWVFPEFGGAPCFILLGSPSLLFSILLSTPCIKGCSQEAWERVSRLEQGASRRLGLGNLYLGPSKLDRALQRRMKLQQ